MSIDATTWAWKQTGLSPAQKLVLLSLADRAGEEHQCWPSMRRLCADTGLTDRGVRKILVELESRGLVRRDMRSGKSTVYTLAGVCGREEQTPELSSPRNTVPPEQRSATPELSSPPPRNTVPPEPKVESNKNPKAEECARTPAPSSQPERDASGERPMLTGRKAKLPPEPKRPYGEFGNVLLTDREYERLVQDYGPEETQAAVEKLDLHLGARRGGDPYRSHYMALRKWVFMALAEDRRRTGQRPQQRPPSAQEGMDFFARMDAIEQQRRQGHDQAGL